MKWRAHSAGGIASIGVVAALLASGCQGGEVVNTDAAGDGGLPSADAGGDTVDAGSADGAGQVDGAGAADTGAAPDRGGGRDIFANARGTGPLDAGAVDGAAVDVGRADATAVDGAGADTGAVDGSGADGGPADGGGGDAVAAWDAGDWVPPELNRGLAWVRANPMFISGAGKKDKASFSRSRSARPRPWRGRGAKDRPVRQGSAELSPGRWAEARSEDPCARGSGGSKRDR